MFAEKRSVLLVEDDFLVALAAKDLLESAGYEVVGPAATLDRALRLVHSERLDAAVLDINIGTQSIWPVADALLVRKVPFVFLSAFANPSSLPTKFASVPQLHKPLEDDRLLDYLRSLWGK